MAGWQRKLAGHQACGPPLLPDSTPNRVAYCLYSGGGRKPHVSAVGACPPQPSWVPPTCLLKYLLYARTAVQTTILAYKGFICNPEGQQQASHVRVTLQFSKDTNLHDCVSSRPRPSGVRGKSGIIPISYVRQPRLGEVQCFLPKP